MNNKVKMNNVPTGKATKKKNKPRQQRQQLAPNTERKASGCNWEVYKNLVSKPKTEESHAQQNRRPKPKRVHTASLIANQLEKNTKHNDIKNKENKTLTKQIAMDCEMVGIGDGTESMLARISIVNKHGECLYDKYVKPREKVVDYRTAVSGIRPEQLRDGEDFSIVQKEVADMLKDRILVGHALKHDLNALFLSHPRRYWRDTSRYKPFRQISKGNTPSLKKLAHELLGREIQVGEHSSVEDARAAMQLYVLYKNKWEESHAQQNRRPKPKRVHTASLIANQLEKNTKHNDIKNKENKTLTKQIAMDCEMVGIGDGTESMLARISIVNKHGECLYDKYVKPREKVVDYRTAVSGIRPEQLRDGEDFSIVQKEVADMLKDRILVGHALKHDLNVLFLSHPRRYWRDTSRYKPFRQISKGNTPSLKKLAHELLGREIQVGEHSSVEDARAAMQLYVLYKNKWESEKKGRW